MSAAAVASSEDLLREILSRLPVRSLVRFKVVCKQWCFLISNPEFSISHARRNCRSNGLLLKGIKQVPGLSLVPLEEYQPPRALPFYFLNKRGTNVLDCCKGLLCDSMADLHDPMLISYYVCHLASGNSSRIGVFYALSRNVRAVVAFDPLKSVHYKVILVHQRPSLSSNFLLKKFIYSSVTQSWKRTKVVIVPCDAGFNNEVVYMNGAIYWYDRTRKAVWYLDLEAECLGRLPLDSKDWLKIDCVKYFGKSSGNLHLIATCNLQTTLLTIYEMEKDRSGWFVKYDCDIGVLADAFPRILCHYNTLHVYHLLYLLEGETQEEAILVLAVPGEVISYNLKTNASKSLCHFEMSGVPPYMRNWAYELETHEIKAYHYFLF